MLAFSDSTLVYLESALEIQKVCWFWHLRTHWSVKVSLLFTVYVHEWSNPIIDISLLQYSETWKRRPSETKTIDLRRPPLFGTNPSYLLLILSENEEYLSTKTTHFLVSRAVFVSRFQCVSTLAYEWTYPIIDLFLSFTSNGQLQRNASLLRNTKQMFFCISLATRPPLGLK